MKSRTRSADEPEIDKGILKIAHRGDTKKLKDKFCLGDPQSINRSIMEALAKTIAPQDIADRIKRLLDAKTTHRDGSVCDDMRAIEAGVKLWLAYTVGLPVQRQEIVSVTATADSAGMEERLRHSPALRDMFRKMLARAEGPITIEADTKAAN